MATDRKMGGAYVDVMARGLAKVQTDLSRLKGGLDAVSKAGDAARDKLNKVGGGKPPPPPEPPKDAAKGFGDVAAALGKQFAALARSIEVIGQVSQKAFLAGTASIIGFLKVADPVGMERLQGTLGALAVQIGSIFIPLIDQATKYLKTALDFFRSLDNATKDQIVSWTKFGLTIAAGIAILSRAAVAIRLVGAALAFASGGILPLLGLLAGLVGSLVVAGGTMDAVGDQVGSFGGFFAALKPAIDAFRSLFLGLWEQLQPSVLAFSDVLRVVAGVVGDTLAGLAPVVRGVLTVIADGFNALLPRLVPIVEKMGEVVGRVVAALTPAVEALLPVFAAAFGVIGEVLAVFGDYFGYVGELVTTVSEVVASTVEGLAPVFEAVFGVIGAAVSALRPVFKTVFDFILFTIQQTSRALIYLGTLFRELANGNFTGALRTAEAAVADFDRRIDERRREAEERTAERRDDRERRREDRQDRNANRPPDEPGRHTPVQGKIEFVGLIDAWKKAQSSVQTENSAEQERLNLARSATGQRERMITALTGIREGTDRLRDTSYTSSGGDWSP